MARIFFVFLVKMDVWMVWNLYIHVFCIFFKTKNIPLYSFLYSAFLRELFHFHYRCGMP